MRTIAVENLFFLNGYGRKSRRAVSGIQNPDPLPETWGVTDWELSYKLSLRARQDLHTMKMAAEWTREEGLAIKLLPGVYDVNVENQDSHENKEFKGITIEAAKAQAVEAQF